MQCILRQLISQSPRLNPDVQGKHFSDSSATRLYNIYKAMHDIVLEQGNMMYPAHSTHMRGPRDWLKETSPFFCSFTCIAVV